jgi:glycolate oxidase iron-sulfur subunit
METHLAPRYQGTHDGLEAEAVLRKCVHCGFCTATCPTYQLLGDELDGPRGRIYLIKQVLEGAEVTRSTQQHLDRCLTCRNCESTCPSGVQYGKLIDIGRKLVDEQVERPRTEKAVRWLLKEGLTSAAFEPAMRLGQLVRPLLPAALKAKVPMRSPATAHVWPTGEHACKVLMPVGCVQPAMMPNINSATARVLDAGGIQVIRGPNGSGCCGALKTHLNDTEGGLGDMRRNVDAWWPLVESGAVESIVMNASGCGVMVKEYGHALAQDPAYAERARRISEITRDVSELLPTLVSKLRGRIRVGDVNRLAFHPPCTLQHGQRVRGVVETHLTDLGFEVKVASSESHLCCGSAGTYSVLQPELSKQLRDRKLGHLGQTAPHVIVSANIGCIQHLQSGTEVPVKHWIEVVDEALRAAS